MLPPYILPWLSVWTFSVFISSTFKLCSEQLRPNRSVSLVFGSGLEWWLLVFRITLYYFARRVRPPPPSPSTSALRPSLLAIDDDDGVDGNAFPRAGGALFFVHWESWVSVLNVMWKPRSISLITGGDQHRLRRTVEQTLIGFKSTKNTVFNAHLHRSKNKTKRAKLITGDKWKRLCTICWFYFWQY